MEIASRSVFRLVPVNLYAFSLSFHTSALLAIVVPDALLRLDYEHHTEDLSRIAAISAVFAMLLPPLIGYLSDRSRVRGGKRMSFIMLGGVANTLGLIGMFFAVSLPVYVAWLFFSLLGQGATLAGYQALWSDTVPVQERGASAGVQGASTLLGNIGGLVLAGVLGGQRVILVMASVMLAGMIVTVVLVPEHRLEADAETLRRRPRPRITNRRDFISVFWSQGLVAFGMTLLMTYVLYFFQDVMHVKNPTGGTASVAVFALVGAVMSSVFMGRISDRFRRRNIVAISGAPMAAAAIGFALLQRPGLLYLFAVLFGLGYGAFLSTGWALAVETLPNPGSVARDLGVWNAASTLPTVIAPICGGWILAMFTANLGTGYQVLFIVAGLFLAAGGLIVLRVGTTTKSPLWGVPVRLLAAVVVAVFLRVTTTLRISGRLPRHRPGTLVVSNHLHDLDGMIIPSHLTLHGPWRHPIRYAASRRLFEPGFMSVRFPGLKRLLYHLNMGRFFEILGTLPIENEPLSRSIASMGFEILETTGNLPLSEVFSDSALERLGAGPTDYVKDLWSRRLVAAALKEGSILDLREPYRTDLIRRQRTVLAAQLARLEQAVEDGDTLYIAPEGRYSADGRLNRFRMALDILLKRAQQVYLATITYDPFAKRRCRIYLTIEPWRQDVPVRLQIRAGRPIAVGHMLADWMLSHENEGVTVKTAVKAIEARVEALPSNVHLAVPSRLLRRQIVSQSLHYMAQLGVLREVNGVYHLTDCRSSAMFPLANDMLLHQKTTFQDTVAAAIEIAAKYGQTERPSWLEGGIFRES